MGKRRAIYGNSNPIDVKNPLVKKALEVVAARIELTQQSVREAAN